MEPHNFIVILRNEESLREALDGEAGASVAVTGGSIRACRRRTPPGPKEAGLNLRTPEGG
jgi:hypothetical protein